MLLMHGVTMNFQLYLPFPTRLHCMNRDKFTFLLLCSFKMKLGQVCWDGVMGDDTTGNWSPLHFSTPVFTSIFMPSWTQELFLAKKNLSLAAIEIMKLILTVDTCLNCSKWRHDNRQVSGIFGAAFGMNLFSLTTAENYRSLAHRKQDLSELSAEAGDRVMYASTI